MYVFPRASPKHLIFGFLRENRFQTYAYFGFWAIGQKQNRVGVGILKTVFLKIAWETVFPKKPKYL
jgi:hypothetical protein